MNRETIALLNQFTTLTLDDLAKQLGERIELCAAILSDEPIGEGHACLYAMQEAQKFLIESSQLLSEKE